MVISVRYPIQQVTKTGAVNQGCIENVEQDLFFFDGKAVRRLSYEEGTFALNDTAISNKIAPTLENIPDDQSKAMSYFVYPYYKLFYRSEGSGTNDTCLRYNVINKSWSTQVGIVTEVGVSGYLEKESMNTAFFGSPFDGTVYKDNSSYYYEDGDIT